MNPASGRRAFALLAVVLMTASLFAVAVPYGEGTGTDATGSSGSTSVTYHHDGSDNSVTETVDYDGIASAEYNPLYWNADNGKGNWSAPKTTITVEGSFTTFFPVGSDNKYITVPDGFEMTGYEVHSVVDGTHVEQEGNLLILKTAKTIGDWTGREYDNDTGSFEVYYSYTISVDAVFGGWSRAPVGIDGNADYHPGDIISVDELYAVWLTPVIYLTGFPSAVSLNSTIDAPDVLTTVGYNDGLTESVDIPWGYEQVDPATGVNEYTRIITVSGDLNINQSLPTGTYRSSDGSVTINLQGTWVTDKAYYSSRVALGGNVIFENITLKQHGKADYSHGDSNRGLYANGHRLTLGVGVKVVSENNDMLGYLQVYGGTSGDELSASAGSYATDVVIFSGTYSNVIAGSFSGIINGDTRLVIRGGIVLDTVQGGNSSRNDTSENSSATGGDRIMGDTHVYILGNAWMPGDYYEESALGNAGRFDANGIPHLTESTILTGGSNDGYISGDTHVYISNEAELWDVQAGGRRGNSTVAGTAHAEVSGSAVVKHVLCGSITDGLDMEGHSGYAGGADKACVGGTDLRVTDGAVVGSVFGAGYDTYYSATYASMLGGSISITIDGDSTVGYVYGGGYRGTIGSESDPIDSISISIDGATVLGDVFGGGRGGLDKVKHNGESGTSPESSSMGDSTGFSKVYADSISVTITDATVLGSVYGGGESVPVITSYNGTPLETSQAAVASVMCKDVSVSVSGDSKVSGDVYGAGKGVDVTDTVTAGGSTYHRSAFIFAVDSDKRIETIPWVGGSGGTVIDSTYGYSGYAFLEADAMKVSVNADIGGSVFSGGMGMTGVQATDVKERILSITGGSITGSVYGGSKLGDDNTPSTPGTSTVSITGGNIRDGTSGNVYGGGYRGTSHFDTHIEIEGAASEVKVRSVYGGSSVGFSDDTDVTGTILLYGDTEIIIGSDVSVSGDVFGTGDFCDISGTSHVRFDGFSQSGSLLSVQRADALDIVSSVLVLDGSTDGTTTGTSERLSLNGIGSLSISQSGGKRSELTVNAGTRSISSYSSTGGSDHTTHNILRINNGMVFSVLGPDDSGSTGAVTGNTTLESDVNDYYGALVTGIEELSGATFWLDGQEVGHVDYKYGSMDVRSWFVGGAFKLEETVIFEGGNVSKDLQVSLPKVSGTSTVQFLGYYVNPYTPGSLDLVTSPSTAGEDFALVIGRDGGTGSTSFENGAGLDVAGASGTVVATGNSGAAMSLSLSTAGTIESTGYAGAITVQMAEVSESGMLLGTFDIQLDVYLEMAVSDGMIIQQDMVMRGDGEYSGSVEVYLPVLGGTNIGTYTLESVSFTDASGSLTAQAVSTHLNKDRWDSSDIRGGTKISGSTTGLVLGTGGGYAPVLKIGYQTTDLIGSFTLNVALSDGAKTYRMSIVVSTQHVATVDVTFADRYIDTSEGSASWKTQELFTIGIDAGTAVSGYYVAVTDPLKWEMETDMAGYYGYVAGQIAMSDGKPVVSTDPETLRRAYTDMTVMTVVELLGHIVEHKPVTDEYNYSEHNPGWYAAEDSDRGFNFGSMVTETGGITVYAGYDVYVTIQLGESDVDDNKLFGFDADGDLVSGGTVKTHVLTFTPGTQSISWSLQTPTYDGYGTVLSLYLDEPQRYASAVGAAFTGVVIDATYYLYVNVQWGCDVPDDGSASVSVSRTDHQNKAVTGSSSGVLYTGDVITVSVLPGYICNVTGSTPNDDGTYTVIGDVEVTTTMSFTVVFKDGNATVATFTGWDSNNDSTIGELFAAAQRAEGHTETDIFAGWATSSGILSDESVPAVGIFTDGTLTLTGIVTVSAGSEESVKESSVTVLATSRDLADGLSIQLGVTSESGLEVSAPEGIDASVEGGVLKITASSVTGAFQVTVGGDGTRVVVTVYVVGTIGHGTSGGQGADPGQDPSGEPGA